MASWTTWTKNVPKDRLEADKAMVDAIREAFGMAPLYARDPKNEKTEEERFGDRVYTETRGDGMRTRYVIGP